MGLDTVALVISLEEEFDIQIPDGVAATLESPRHAGDYIETRLIEDERGLPRSTIDERIKNRTIEISGIHSDNYALDKKFVRDFGLD